MLNDDLELITKSFENTSFFIDNIEQDKESDDLILNIKARDNNVTIYDTIKMLKKCFGLSEHIKEIVLSKVMRIRRKQIL
ncbi:hypothetical protein [Campylobacter concisus]|uniref:hypothetical protein n=1 Tax=Campylobacter concisus TaxID=199 RepID=UPI0011E63525|nr:hypothetical protein [Campylobacter concisus]